MAKYKLDGKYPAKVMREPITDTSIINLDSPEYARPLFCKITEIVFGKHESFGNYITFKLFHEKFGNTFIRKTLNIDYTKGKYEEYLPRETKILAEMFKIDDSENWKKIEGETIAIILKRRTDKTKKEIRNDKGHVLIGCTIISPDEIRNNPELLDAYEPDNDETETPKEEKKKINEIDYICEICKEKYLLNVAPLDIVNGKRTCTICLKREYELKQQQKKNVCEKCKQNVKEGLMKQHIKTDCKMFVAKG